MHAARRLQRSDAPSISYDDLGSGEPALLFTPGWCVSRNVFAALPALCAQRHGVLSVDWRGHGDSGATTGDFGETAAYAREHPWFQVHKLPARSQFPMFEVPDEMARLINLFVGETDV